MSTPPEMPQVAPASDQYVQYCYAHTETPTKLNCSRCGRPICGRCAIPASVGQHCPECVAEARRSAPRIKTVLEATAPGVRSIIGICVVVFLLQFFSGNTVTNQIAMVPGDIRDGEWWRLATAMFAHGGPLHIVLNMYVLYMYGPIVEQAYGTARFLLLYLLSGLLGSALSFALPPEAASVGASGAIFGVVGILIAYTFRRRRNTFAGQYLGGLAFFVGFNLLFGFVSPSIDNFAHIGGLVGGIILGYAFDRGAATEARGSGASQTIGVLVVAAAIGLLLLSNL